jgi:transposase
MTKAKGTADKNLSNVVDALEVEPVNSHQAQQLQQDKNDRRHQDALNHDQPANMEHQKS